MTDRELLELAAKAAGETIREVRLGEEVIGFMWNPLMDDAVALRLAVALKLDITFFRGFEEVKADGEGAKDTPALVGEWAEATEPFGSDIQAATRRAITRAAAEIGRSMP